MILKVGWKLKIAKIKADIARQVKQDYLTGSTVPELMKNYGLTKKTVYKWIAPTLEEQNSHMAEVMAKNKMGRPKFKKQKRSSVKISDVANTEY